MTPYGTWRPYDGIASALWAALLLVVAAALLFLAIRIPHPIAFRRAGKTSGIVLISLWLLSGGAFIAAAILTGRALLQQVGHLTPPVNPITPVTFVSGVLTFFVIVYFAQHLGFRGAYGSAIIGTIVTPMIFELPFDLIVMWRVYLPTPTTLFMLLYFTPLLLVAILSIALLTLSPVASLSRYTLLLLAGMFLIFAVWAVFGFAYPATPLPIALNMLAKVLAFAASVSLFVPQVKVLKISNKLANIE